VHGRVIHICAFGASLEAENGLHVNGLVYLRTIMVTGITISAQQTDRPYAGLDQRPTS
jgi:hypothetical protein